MKLVRPVFIAALVGPTIDPLWADVQDAGNVTTATVQFSKDTWLFGVRAVDAAGHRSPAGYPTPVR
jgi:hypothetical protein